MLIPCFGISSYLQELGGIISPRWCTACLFICFNRWLCFQKVRGKLILQAKVRKDIPQDPWEGKSQPSALPARSEHDAGAGPDGGNHPEVKNLCKRRHHTLPYSACPSANRAAPGCPSAWVVAGRGYRSSGGLWGRSAGSRGRADICLSAQQPLSLQMTLSTCHQQHTWKTSSAARIIRPTHLTGVRGGFPARWFVTVTAWRTCKEGAGAVEGELSSDTWALRSGWCPTHGSVQGASGLNDLCGSLSTEPFCAILSYKKAP